MRFAAILPLACLLIPAALFGQKTNYEIRFNGKVIGKDTVTIKKGKQGYEVSTQYGYAIGPSEGRFSNDYRLDDTYQWLTALASNMNLGIRYVDALDKTRTRLSISINQNGAGSNSELPVRADVELLPSLDPAAAQLLLLRATTNPTANNKYNIVAPSFGEPEGMANLQAARDGTASSVAVPIQLPSGRQSYDAAWQKDKDVSGTLDGKPVTAHTYNLIFGSFHWVFIGDDSNSLLQMNVLPKQPVFVRQGFVLDPKDAEALSLTP